MVTFRRNIRKNIATFSHHASRMSRRFMHPMTRRKNDGIMPVRPHTTTSHHRRARLVGISSIAFGALLTTMPASLLKCGVMGEPPGPLSFLSHSEPHPPSSASPYFGAAPTLGVRRPPPAYRALASWYCVPFVPVRVSKRLSLLSL